MEKKKKDRAGGRNRRGKKRINMVRGKKGWKRKALSGGQRFPAPCEAARVCVYPRQSLGITRQKRKPK